MKRKTISAHVSALASTGGTTTATIESIATTQTYRRKREALWPRKVHIELPINVSSISSDGVYSAGRSK